MKFTYAEGATPIDDISGLIPSWVRTQSDLNQVEAENIFSAAGKYLNNECFQSMINFRKRRLEYKRVHHPDHHAACDPVHLVSSFYATVINRMVVRGWR